MEEKFGLFKANGEHTQYGSVACTGLTKMHFMPCDSLEELEAMIESDPNIPATDFIILQYREYTKQMS